MKKQYKLYSVICIFILVFICSVICSAAPIDGLPQTLTQPDGTEVTVYFHGDEIYSYMADEEGKVIVEDPDSGYYVYATLSDNSIVPTEHIYGGFVLSGADEDISNILIADNIPQNIYEEAYKNSSFNTESNTIEPMSFNCTDKYTELNGMNVNNIVVFINFRANGYDEKNLSYYEDLFNDGDASAKKYFEEASYGKIGINSTFYPTTTSSKILTYTDTNYSTYYSGKNYNYDEDERKYREQTLLKNALEYVKEQIPEDMELDRNNDGCVDMITFILPGKVLAGENQIRWPHAWSFDSEYSTTINGLETCNYNVQIEGAFFGYNASNDTDITTSQSGSAIICHEILHILGFPDMYYAKNFGKNPLGEWDIMCNSNGAHPSAYMKSMYGGWLDITEIKEDGTYTVNSLIKGENCAYKLRSPYSANEYFIVEYRNNTGTFESKVPNKGLVIYRVLAEHHGDGNNDAQTGDGTNDELRVITSITSGTYSLKLSDSSTAGIKLSSISISSDSAEFKVTFTEKKHLNYFKDKNLADEICLAIGKAEEDITDEDLDSLESLIIYGDIKKQSYDLSGIENLTGLKTLSLIGCGIDDIDYLQGLTNLTNLVLNDNTITDISALSNLTNLQTLKLRGNMIDDYSPTSSYYSNLTEKDFSLDDINDAVFYVPEITDGLIGEATIKLSNTQGEHFYYSLEKYNKNTDELLSRARGNVGTTGSECYVDVPNNINDTADTYVALKIYENETFKHLMSETIVDSACFNLEMLN